MTDEELAEIIVRGSICDMCNAHCDAYKTPEDCVHSVCAWLKQEVSLLDRLAAEYDRKHPNGLKLAYSLDGEVQQTEQEEKENERI